MKASGVFVTLCVCATVLGSVAMLGRAGDLNPPPGPIEPSMRTLDKLYELVETRACPIGPMQWQYFHLDTPFIQLPIGDPPLQLIEGSGHLHGLIFSGLCTWSDGAGNLIGRFNAVSTSTIVLDVPFENGLFVSNGAIEGGATVLYLRSAP